MFVRLRKSEEMKDDLWKVKDNTLYHQISDREHVVYSGFDKVSSQKKNIKVYEEYLKQIVLSSVNGTNCTIFAYGQTGSGKTYTMLGTKSDPGIIKLSLTDIFRVGVDEVSVSYIEIYNERIYDLVDPKKSVKLFNVSQQPKLSNVSEIVVKASEQVFDLLEYCENNRKIGCTEFNARSSRSHTIFIAKIKKMGVKSVLCLIDLAGSEKAADAHKRRLEGSFINKSLLALGKVVNNMSKSGFVGFRDSKLTRILQPYMDGSSRLVALCMISPSKKCVEESISTINFAARLGKVKLEPRNEKIELSVANVQTSPIFFCKSCRCALEKPEYSQESVPQMLKPVKENLKEYKKKECNIPGSYGNDCVDSKHIRSNSFGDGIKDQRLLKYTKKKWQGKHAANGVGSTYLSSYSFFYRKSDIRDRFKIRTLKLYRLRRYKAVRIPNNSARQQMKRKDESSMHKIFHKLRERHGEEASILVYNASFPCETNLTRYHPESICFPYALYSSFSIQLYTFEHPSRFIRLDTLLQLRSKIQNSHVDMYHLKNKEEVLSKVVGSLFTSAETSNSGSGRRCMQDKAFKLNKAVSVDAYKNETSILRTHLEEYSLQNRETLHRDSTSRLTYVIEQNKFLLEKIILNQQRIDSLEEKLISLYSEFPSKSGANAFTIEKNLFSLKCKLLEKKFLCRTHK